MIRGIFFDLDDTLLWDEKSIKLAFENTCKIAEEKYGVDHQQLEEAVRKEARELYASYETFPFTQMIGINPFEGLWGDFHDEWEPFARLAGIVPAYRTESWRRGLLAAGIDDKDFAKKLGEQFPLERKKVPIVYDDTYEVLEKLKGNYKLLLLTNGSPQLQNLKLALTPKLRPYFNEIVISGDFRKGKPDPAIFEFALNKIGLEKDEVLMVGDNLMTDILGANRTGIKSVWLNRHGKERNEVTPTYEIAKLEELLTIL